MELESSMNPQTRMLRYGCGVAQAFEPASESGFLTASGHAASHANTELESSVNRQVGKPALHGSLTDNPQMAKSFKWTLAISSRAW